MKKIKLLISFFGFLFLIINLQSGNNPYQIISGNYNMIPDVMNNVNVLNADGSVKTIKIETDSFPIFPGFPKNISGSAIEGNIYCNMDTDSDLEILFCIGYTIQAWNIDGSNVPGWPVTVSGYPLEGAPAFGDIDGDGQGEIVATSHGLTSGGYIYAFKKNGTPAAGFPINHGYTTRTPVLAHLDYDGKMEIIVNKRLYPVGEVYVYKGTNVMAGWPKPINHVPASSAAVGDVNGDGSPEIVMESYSSLYVWNSSGDSLPGFPFTMPNGDVNSYSSPVLADVDTDGKREIIFGTHVLSAGGYVYVLKYNGTVLSGWPKYASYWIYGPPAVGFIDNDNILDIAVGDQVLSPSGPADFLYAWNKNGTPLTGFPIGSLNAINDQVVLGDIDNDAMTELIIDDNTTSTSGMGQYLAFNHDATPAAGFPIVTTGTTFFITPSLTDLNGNGTLDLIGGGKVGTTSTNVYIWNLGVQFTPSKIYNPMWQYNERHNGVYGDNMTGVQISRNIIPDKYILHQNYPNPFNPKTIINYQLPMSNYVKLVIHDIVGREITTLVNQRQEAGPHETVWDAANYPSGVYFYTITSGDFKETKKMILLK